MANRVSKKHAISLKPLWIGALEKIWQALDQSHQNTQVEFLFQPADDMVIT